jgi:hypothetical protein
MLASTVQFSTNNQPTTQQPHTSHQEHNPQQAGSLTRYARPGHAWTVPKQQPGPKTRSCSFRTQQGANHLPPAAPTSLSATTTWCVLSPPAVAEENSPVSPPVSTPPPHTGSAGYWTTFAV